MYSCRLHLNVIHGLWITFKCNTVYFSPLYVSLYELHLNVFLEVTSECNSCVTFKCNLVHFNQLYVDLYPLHLNVFLEVTFECNPWIMDYIQM